MYIGLNYDSNLFRKWAEMTAILKFIFDRVADIFRLGFSLKFEIFGYSVSVFEITIGFSIILLILSFFRMFVDEPIGGTGMTVINHVRKENRQDKQQEMSSNAYSEYRRKR